MKYTTLLLDADNTLFDFSSCEYNALKNTVEYGGREFSQDVFESFDRINGALWRKFERSEINASDLRVERFRELIELYEGIRITAEEMSCHYIDELSHQAVLFPNTLEDVALLSSEFDLYVITNGFRTVQRGRFSGSPVTPYIKDIFISDELNVQKPRKEFFDRALERVSEKNVSRILVVGDTLNSDMQGGRNAGIDTCLFDPEDKVAMPNDLCDYKIRRLSEIMSIAAD